MDKTLFQELNKPFAYNDYSYNSNDSMVYVGGQVVAERLNEVLGVGYWKYEPIFESIKTVDTGKKDRNGASIISLNLLIKFSIWNKEIQDWVTFIDSGSQKMNPKMQESDATKSAITDGMKKCASRIGVASDLYAGRISADSNGKVILPYSYKDYYMRMGWADGIFAAPPKLMDQYVGRLKRVKEGLDIKDNDELNPYVQEALKADSATFKDITNDNAPVVLNVLESKVPKAKPSKKEAAAE